MKMTLELKTIDGEESLLTTLPADFIAWERHTKRKISDLSEGIAMEDLAFLAYSIIKRQGVIVKPFDSWINSIEDIEPKEEAPKATS